MLVTKMVAKTVTNIFYLSPTTRFVSNSNVTTSSRRVKNPFLFTKKAFSAQFFILIRLNCLNQFLYFWPLSTQKSLKITDERVFTVIFELKFGNVSRLRLIWGRLNIGYDG